MVTRFVSTRRAWTRNIPGRMAGDAPIGPPACDEPPKALLGHTVPRPLTRAARPIRRSPAAFLVIDRAHRETEHSIAVPLTERFISIDELPPKRSIARLRAASTRSPASRRRGRDSVRQADVPDGGPLALRLPRQEEPHQPDRHLSQAAGARAGGPRARARVRASSMMSAWTAGRPVGATSMVEPW
jgi:hypothetical protein